MTTNTSQYKNLKDLTDADVEAAAIHWATRYPNYIGQRAISIWLTYEGNVAWSEDDAEAFNDFVGKVAARRFGE